MLEATWRLIEESPCWRLPEMSRSLVERSVHSSALEAISSSGGAAWKAHAERVSGVRRGDERQADLNLIDRTTPYSETIFSDTDGPVATRLGQGDRRVSFEQPFTGPFGLMVDELVVRAAWVADVAPTGTKASSVIVHDGVARFVFGNKAFIYDRHGLRKAKAASDEIADDDGP
jgi:hypothetical protein